MGERSLEELSNIEGLEDAGSSMSLANEILNKYNLKDIGDPDTLCNMILVWVVEQKYDIVIKELRKY